MDITVIILAAGKGKRMQSSLPKALHKVAGITILEHLLITATHIKANDIRVIINDVLKSNLEFKQLTKKYNFNSFIQETQLGTADAVSCAYNEKINNSYVLILPGDCPLISSTTIDRMYLSAQNNALCCLGFKAHNPSGYGRFVIEENKLLKIVEERDANDRVSKIDLCNSGIMLVKADLLQAFLVKISNTNQSNEYYLTDIIEIANGDGYECKYLITDEAGVLGINTLSQLAVVEEIIQNKLRQKFLSEGVILLAPYTNFFSYDTIVSGGVKIYPFVFFGPSVVIEEGCEIFSFSHIEGAKIGKNCKVGPSSHLRSGATLMENVKIGNFVEVKQSTIGHASKASHLAYIGDASIGRNCNIGAGAIFCNYDGIVKNSTTIGDNVFIGSNTSLIAPLDISNNVLVAAGSVITDDIECNHLAIARSKQINKVKKKS